VLFVVVRLWRKVIQGFPSTMISRSSGDAMEEVLEEK
jgi:hypothetical protein